MGVYIDKVKKSDKNYVRLNIDGNFTAEEVFRLARKLMIAAKQVKISNHIMKRQKIAERIQVQKEKEQQRRLELQDFDRRIK